MTRCPVRALSVRACVNGRMDAHGCERFCATDSKAHVPADAAPYLAHARPDALPLQHDIPLGLVNRVVYGPRPPRDRRPARPGSEHDRAGGAFAGEPTAGDRAGR